MILDIVEHLKLYVGLHKGFAAAMEFLRRDDLIMLPPGRYEIKGADVYAIVDHVEGRGRAASLLEAHERYIDIQAPLKGVDVIGYRPLGKCSKISGEYDEARDIAFYSDEPESWLTLSPGMFAIFFPHDAHAPLAGEERIIKVVVKVAIKS